MTQFSTGFATEEDKDALVDLQKAAGGGDAGGFATKEDFEHWYLRHPFGRVTIPVVRAPDDSFVGAAWIFPMRMSIRGRVSEIANAANLHIRPEYQGTFAYTVLSRHLGRALRKRTALHFSLVSPQTYHRQRDVQPGLVTPLPWLVRVLDPDAWARRYGQTGWRRTIRPLIRAAAHVSFHQRSPPKTGRVRVRTVPDFDERFDSFWDAIRTQYSVTPERSSAFLRWRFRGQKLRSYVVLMAESSTQTLGYLVFRTMPEHGIDVGYIVDLVVTVGAEGDQAGAALLQVAEGHLRDLGVAVVSTALPRDSREASLLRNAGFRGNPFERVGRGQSLWPTSLRAALFVHDPNAISATAQRARDWYLTLAAHEQI